MAIQLSLNNCFLYGQWKPVDYITKTLLMYFAYGPILVNEFYRWKLMQIKILYVGGLDWGFKYRPFPGYMYNLGDMIMHFRLKEKETIIFTFNGVAIDYRARSKHGHDDSADVRIQSFEEKPKSG